MDKEEKMPLLTLSDSEMKMFLSLEEKDMAKDPSLKAIRAIALQTRKNLDEWTGRYTPVVIHGVSRQQDNISILLGRMERLLRWLDEAEKRAV